MKELQHRKLGYFFVFEGIDGSGKSTQCQMLAEALRARGHHVVETREPTDGTWGKQIRQRAREGIRSSPEEELALFIRDRREHIETLIQPSLDAGSIVIQDRYYFSSTAYQGSRGLDPVEILSTHRAFAPQPTKTFLLRISADEGMERIQKNRSLPPDAFEKKQDLEKCVAIFDEMDEPSMVRLDGNLPVDELHQTILNEVLPFFDMSI